MVAYPGRGVQGQALSHVSGLFGYVYRRFGRGHPDPVYAPDDITLGRLDNDRVRGVLTEEASNAVGGAVRLMFHVGAPPQASPRENLQNLLKFSSQFDNIQIK